MNTFIAVLMLTVAFGIVSWPILRKARQSSSLELSDDAGVGELLSQKDAALFALNELETDFEVGSLSPGDYQELKKKYVEKAVGLIKAVDDLKSELKAEHLESLDFDIESRISSLRATGPSEEDIEGRVLALRKKGGAGLCSACGAKVGPGASFCFRCGHTLGKKCPGCGSAVRETDGFCMRCGASLSDAVKSRKATR